ncbi:MAG: symmetrical bis(5'-nucleosyl)-tetraphosphatase [Gammaproteobacteria bacterium]|nr:symmetrical bis(5'-nucleosyl)-tetraphosphatase [Gammaproteobacteria bacterium]MDE2345001.1 symmetrical bis(5'-nucleosyl)-tetraphosphatase [Gammaproteobacteria bacterium]
MAVFAVGDIQGCFDDLQRLLERLKFNADEDTLWFTGDLVNRGPQSLEVLRFVKNLGPHAVSVLGNHDLHLLALAAGVDKPKAADNLDAVLSVSDRDELLDWLRHRPLLHQDEALGYTLIHAGLPPQWDAATAQSCAHELEYVLRGHDYLEFFQHMYGDQPNRWAPALRGMPRLRFIVNCFTRLRYVSAAGDLDLESKGAPGTQPQGYLPWFLVPDRASANLHILFGHWSTLGEVRGHNVYPLDTGCVWGGKLSALRLDGDDSGSWYCVDCPGARRPEARKPAVS